MALSHSGLTLYQQCPLAFQKRYITKEKGVQGETSPALQRGTDTHQHFEDYLNGDVDGLDPDHRKWDAMMAGLLQAGATAEMEFGLTKDYEVCGFDDEEAFLRGKIDACYVEGDTVNIYEWKTGKQYPEHAQQRQLYALAAMAMHPDAKLVIVSTPYLDLGVITEEEFTPANQLTLKWTFTRKVNKTQPPQDYRPRPSWKCRFCEYAKGVGGTCPV